MPVSIIGCRPAARNVLARPPLLSIG